MEDDLISVEVTEEDDGGLIINLSWPPDDPRYEEWNKLSDKEREIFFSQVLQQKIEETLGETLQETTTEAS